MNNLAMMFTFIIVVSALLCIVAIVDIIARRTYFFDRLGNTLGNALNNWLKPLPVISILALAAVVWMVHRVTSMQAKQHADLVAQYEKISN